MKVAVTVLLLLCVAIPYGCEAVPSSVVGDIPVRLSGLKTSYAVGELVAFSVDSLRE
jgi:hypothetical protein